MPIIEPSVFLSTMGNVAATVTVVTTYAEHGQPLGLTVSAFSSVSLDPPIVLVCIDKSAQSLPALLERSGFTINFLLQGHGEVAMQMASRSENKFEGVEFSEPSSDVAGPILRDCSFAYFECRTRETIDAGDHWVLLADVTAGAHPNEGDPLVYFNRSFVHLQR